MLRICVDFGQRPLCDRFVSSTRRVNGCFYDSFHLPWPVLLDSCCIPLATGLTAVMLPMRLLPFRLMPRFPVYKRGRCPEQISLSCRTGSRVVAESTVLKHEACESVLMCMEDRMEMMSTATLSRSSKKMNKSDANGALCGHWGANPIPAGSQRALPER